MLINLHIYILADLKDERISKTMKHHGKQTETIFSLTTSTSENSVEGWMIKYQQGKKWWIIINFNSKFLALIENKDRSHWVKGLRGPGNGPEPIPGQPKSLAGKWKMIFPTGWASKREMSVTTARPIYKQRKMINIAVQADKRKTKFSNRQIKD